MQQQKVQMSKKQFRIGDLAEELRVKKFVIRFWEKEFGIQSDRSEGGQRFYTAEDLQTFMHIKDLLYNKGFTIAGAKKQLQENVISAEIQEDVSCNNSCQQLSSEQEQVEQDHGATGQVGQPPCSEEVVTPATKVSCSCGNIMKQCKELKDHLIDFKQKLGY